ncbi:MAG: hypothetical protein JRL30_00820 [Deltaproteobacteria bacterium]|nr:hypothetical protein [Deltaproteobacteria bacterium]
MGKKIPKGVQDALDKAAKKDEPPSFEDLIRANEILKANVRKLESAHATFDRVIREVYTPLPPWTPRKRRKSKRPQSSAEEMHSAFSDTQIGTKAKAVNTSGLGGWNRDSYLKALDMWVDKKLRILEVQRADHPVNKLVIWGLGDYVEGEDIFPGQAWHLDMDGFDQVAWGTAVTAKAIYRLYIEGEFNEGIDLIAVPGNHGRLGKRGVIKANLDDFFILGLAQAFCRVEGVRIHHCHPGFAAVQIQEKWGFVISHGDETRGWMGLPYYGLQRDGLKALGIFRFPIHFHLRAHHHQTAGISIGPDQTLMVNGSWPGPTNFSVQVLKAAMTPSQTVWFMHHEQGLTAEYKIRLGDVPILKPDPETGIYTPTREPVVDPIGGDDE